jgi:hypothetical protein
VKGPQKWRISFQSSKPELSMNKSFTPPNDLSLGQKQIPAVAIDNNDSSNGNGNKNGNNGDDRYVFLVCESKNSVVKYA